MMARGHALRLTARGFLLLVGMAWGLLPAPTRGQGVLESEPKRPPDMDRLAWHLGDPELAVTYTLERLTEATRPADRKFAEAIVTRLRAIERPNKVRLSLEDVLHRALTYSHAVRVESYTPAIDTAGVVSAEAAFDAVFFTNMTKNVQDRPSASQLAGTKIDNFSLTGGFRKLLPSGAQVSTSLNIRRDFVDIIFQLLNPQYTSAFVAEIRQPMLRGAGIDFNRSQIEIANNDRRISQAAFKRQVRETLFETEQAYWRLVQARREVTISARLLSEFEKIYDYLWQRRDFDTYQIQLSQTKASLETQKADFISLVSAVKDAEDRLLVLMNDPKLNLAEDVEIIPTDFPSDEPVEVDAAGAVQEALEKRSEIRESRWLIDNADLRVGIAKNQALPQLDVLFRYTVDGLGPSADDAFDEVTQSDFMEYLVVVDFEVPVGNRERQALLRQARLAHAQQIAALKFRIEQIILEVNLAIRAIRTAFDRLEPNLQSADANEAQVASVVARQERKDFTALNQELSARRSLASSRSALLDSLIRYNVAVIALERFKGTLLDYDNVILSSPDNETDGPDIEIQLELEEPEPTPDAD